MDETNTLDQKTLKRVREAVQTARARMKVTKLTATRCLKTTRGEFFAGMTVDCDPSASVEEARVTHVLLSMEASIAAWRAALSEGALTPEQFEARVRDLKVNTVAHISRILPEEKE